MTLNNGEETIDLNAQGAGTVINNNATHRSNKLEHIMSATKICGSTAVADAAAETVNTLTDSSGGTPATTIAAVSGSGDDSNVNNNFASLTTEIANLKADNASLRTQLNALLAELRKTGGCGIIADNP